MIPKMKSMSLPYRVCLLGLVLVAIMVVACGESPTSPDRGFASGQSMISNKLLLDSDGQIIPEPAFEDTPALSGEVTSTYLSGPVADIRVWIVSVKDSQVQISVKTDQAGHFEIDSLPVGVYSVTCSLEGHEEYHAQYTYFDAPLRVIIELQAIPFYVVRSISVPGAITALGTGESGLWVGLQRGWGNWEVRLRDPKTLTLLQSISVDFRVSGLTQQGDSLWISSDENPDRIRLIDLSANPPAVVDSFDITVGYYIGGLYWDGERFFMWHSSAGGSVDWAAIRTVDIQNSFSVTAEYAPPTAFPHSIVKASGYYWISSSYPRSFHRLDPETLAVLEQYEPPFTNYSSYSVIGQLTWAEGHFFSSNYMSSQLYQMRDNW